MEKFGESVEAIFTLAKKSAGADKADDAMKFAQAAANLANALTELIQVTLIEPDNSGK